MRPQNENAKQSNTCFERYLLHVQVGSDWQSILWFKIHYLQGMSLSPWYQKPINSRL